MFDKVKDFFYSNRINFAMIGIFLSFLWGFYILGVYLIWLVIISTFKYNVTQNIPGLKSLKEILKANAKVRNHHKKEEFPVLFHFLSILTWTLVCSFLTTMVLAQNSTITKEILFSFRQNWVALLLFSLTLQFLYELYILAFCNTKSPKPIAEVCATCAKWGAGLVTAIGAAEVTGIIEPTDQTLDFRKASGMDVYETNALKAKHKAILNNLGDVKKPEIFTEKAHFAKPKTFYWSEKQNFPLDTISKDSNYKEPKSFGLEKDFEFKNTFWEANPEKMNELITKHEPLLREKASLSDKKILFPKDFDKIPPVRSEHNINVNIRPGLPNSKK